jgi:hypothetical protein
MDLDIPPFALGTDEPSPPTAKKLSGSQNRKKKKDKELVLLGEKEFALNNLREKARARDLTLPVLHNAMEHLKLGLEANFMRGMPEAILQHLEAYFLLDFEAYLQKRHKNTRTYSTRRLMHIWLLSANPSHFLLIC